MPPVAGVRSATAACGVRYPGRRDAVLFELAGTTAVAGVFTRSATAAAPVVWCQYALQQSGGRGRAMLVNAGNANAFTGRRGDLAVNDEASAVGEALGCPLEQVYLASTGVIGEALPVERITGNVPALATALAPGGWEAAADAIRTTDTFPKGASKQVELDGTRVTIAGIAKGSGMIQPDMATMLGFIFTDANIAPDVLAAVLQDANDLTFNCISVDGDTSTSDTVLLAATGRADHVRIADAGDRRLAGFRAALMDVMRDLAQQIVRDGEGAEKFATIRISGATDRLSARRIGFAIANSPLVKTAIAGSDPNWGRIVMAVGKAGEPADRDRLAISIGGIPVAQDGEAVPDYDESPVQRHMAGREIDIAVDVGIGAGRATVWTCDLTHGYIDINADYRS
jgi:glutamate N-acetyltransferase/amino-acid N-acetyltransferase